MDPREGELKRRNKGEEGVIAQIEGVLDDQHGNTS
jgi:hypothetical protein